MKFNICYMGPEWIFHLRRDFILLLQYSLEELGHDVILSAASLESGRFNLIIGGYFLPGELIPRIAESGVEYAHVNTEVIAQDMLNFNPKKVDFLGLYLPSMKRGKFIWDILLDNMSEHYRYGNNAHFLRWGSQPRLREIDHRKNKDLDYYFFGSISQRRKELIKELQKAGVKGLADGSCPYFLRNDRISRSKIQLNLIQDDKYTHVNNFRICYLAENSCCVLSEREHDPAGYLSFAEVADREFLVERIHDLVNTNAWRERGDRAGQDFSAFRMKGIMSELLEESFAK